MPEKVNGHNLLRFPDYRGGLNIDAEHGQVAPNELVVADNADLVDRGGMAKRWGWDFVNTTSFGAQVTQLIKWPRDDGTVFYLAVVGGNLIQQHDNGNTETICAVNRSEIGYFFLQDKFYFCDGRYMVWNGVLSPSQVEFDSPSSAPIVTAASPVSVTTDDYNNGSSFNGVYKFKVTFVNSSGSESAASAESSLTVRKYIDFWNYVYRQLNWSNIPIGPSDITARKLYRTKANGDVYYYVATISDNTTTTYTDTSYVESGLTTELNASNNLSNIGNCRFMVRHPKSQRIFAGGDGSNKVYYSEIGDPTVFQETSFVVPTYGDGPLKSLGLFYDAVVAFYEKSIWIWRGIDPGGAESENPDAIWERLPVQDGSIAPKTTDLITNAMTYLGTGGWWALHPSILQVNAVLSPGETMIRDLTENKVQKYIQAITNRSGASGDYDVSNRKYFLAFDDTILAFDYDLAAFTRYTGYTVNDVMYRADGKLWIASENYILERKHQYKDAKTDGTYQPITFDVKTPELNLGTPFYKKIIYGVWVSLKNIIDPAFALRVRVYIDGFLKMDYNYTPATDDEIIKVRFGADEGLVDAIGKTVSVQLTNNQMMDTYIYGIAIEFDIVNSYGGEL